MNCFAESQIDTNPSVGLVVIAGGKIGMRRLIYIWYQMSILLVTAYTSLTIMRAIILCRMPITVFGF